MSVASEIGKGTLYNALAKYFGIIINLVVTGILARLLSPDDFGVVAITTVIITFFDLLGNMGFGPAVIQNKNLDNKDIASIFNLSFIIAVCFAILCFNVSPLVGSVYKNDKLPSIMQILSIQVLFTILNSIPYSLLLKSKKFKYIAVVNVLCQLAFGIIAVICAYSGLGIYSLLIAPICSIIVNFFVYSVKSSMIYGSYFFFILNPKSIKKVLSFSLFQFLFNIVNYFSRNLDKLFIGNKFSMSELGYYEKSYRLMQLPISNISSIMAPTIQPVLSEYQDDISKLYHYIGSIVTILAYIGCTLTPLLFFCSNEIILIAFGSKWEAAIPIFKILSLSVFAQVIDSSTGSMLQAANAPKLLFLSGLVCAVINASAICIGVFLMKSLISLSWLLNFAFLSNLLIDLVILFKLTLKVNLVNIARLFVNPLVITLITSLTLFTLNFVTIENVVLKFSFCSCVTILESMIFANIVGLIDLKKLYFTLINGMKR